MNLTYDYLRFKIKLETAVQTSHNIKHACPVWNLQAPVVKTLLCALETDKTEKVFKASNVSLDSS